MLGAILGDIVGSTYEFANTKDYHFDLFPEGSNYTDDSILTVAVADAILKKTDYGKSIRDWALRYPHPKGAYGGSFSRWLSSGSTKPYGSYGNGSAMRVCAVGWLFDSEQTVLDEARRSAECTHNHPEGIKGAQAAAIAVFFARKGKDKTYIKDYISNNFGYLFNRSTDELNKTYTFNETCQGTVPEALTCFFESKSFEDAIRKAIYIGGDSDTIGAITGGVAEAFYGIPDKLAGKARTFLPDDMISVLKEFENRINIQALDVSSETKYLRKRYLALKKEFSELFLQRQNLQLHEQPLLTALYLQKVGYKLYETYSLEVELSQLKFKIALMQSYVNRNEKPDMNKVNQEIKSRFAEYRQKIETEAKQLAAAREFLNGTFLSAEEVKKIKEIYYIIVKRLHPDINPDLPENMKDLFVKAETAYELSDLSTLQEILLLLEIKKTEMVTLLPGLKEKVSRLEENNKTLSSQIERLTNEFPFTYKEKLNDEKWIKGECDTLNTTIEHLKKEIEKLKNYITLLDEWKPELQN
ncbi:MAG: ADP-ribosylglycohydrolase family protein [Porphyromonadaceae bacterium]|nr:ADP-ribosylglycohydrolase family protein [Porphyromonadaceae bacterium]